MRCEEFNFNTGKECVVGFIYVKNVYAISTKMAYFRYVVHLSL